MLWIDAASTKKCSPLSVWGLKSQKAIPIIIIKKNRQQLGWVTTVPVFCRRLNSTQNTYHTGVEPTAFPGTVGFALNLKFFLDCWMLPIGNGDFQVYKA
jgi:hypothetical protein